MLHHTSGLRDWGSIEWIAGWPRGTRVYTHAHVLDILGRQRAPELAASHASSYSHSGSDLSTIISLRAFRQIPLRAQRASGYFERLA